MSILEGFSEPFELPNIPDEPGVAIIEDERGQALEVVESIRIRRRLGELLDSKGIVASQGPRIHDAQKEGARTFMRWKLTRNHKAEKKRLVEMLNPLLMR